MMASIPVLRELTPTGRVAFLVTFALSVVAIAMEWLLEIHGTPIFVASAAGILGLAYVVGISTERLGALAGPQVGGILNATFGNIAELIIAFFALSAGQLEVVKASITGSIIGNLLLVLGASFFFGGLRNGMQRFSARVAGLDATLLVLAVIGLFVPAVFAFSQGAGTGGGHRIEESLLISVVLLALYFVNLFYRFRHPEDVLGGDEAPASTPARPGGPAWPSACWAWLPSSWRSSPSSSWRPIDPFIEQFDLTPFFVGVILIPTIGNLSEHLVGVQLAVKDRMDFSMAVSIDSSLQVALFVAPVLVFLGILVNQPMDLVFAPLEIAAVATAAAICALVSLDGESNWLEGTLLMGVYLILAVSFFYLV